MKHERGPGRFDLILACVAALVVLVASSLAYRSAETHHDDGRFVGILADNLHVSMGGIYGSFAREVLDGGGLFVHNNQTSEPHEGAQARPWEWLIGKLGRMVGPADEAAFVFHADRIIAAILWALTLAWLASELFATRLARGLAVACGLCFVNLYWVVEWVGRTSAFGASLRTWMDGGHSEVSGLGFGYASVLLGVPHLVLELAFLCGVLAAALAVLRLDEQEARTGERDLGLAGSLPNFGGRRVGVALVGGLCFLGLASARPYTAPVAAFAVAGLMALRVVRLGFGAGGAPGDEAPSLPRALLCSLGLGLCIGLPALPLLVHQMLLLKGGSVFSGLDVLHLSPPLLEQAMFLGLGLPVALVATPFALRRLAGERATAAPLLVVGLWILAGTALTNGAPLIPWEVEAFLPMALAWLLLALLSVEALAARRRLPVAAVGGTLLVASLVGVGFRMAELNEGLERRLTHLWMSSDTAALVDHLEAARSGLDLDQSSPVVATDQRRLAPLLPWLAGVRVFVGHPDHTPNPAVKKGFFERFRLHGQGIVYLFDAGVTHVATRPLYTGEVDQLDGNPNLERELDLTELGPKGPGGLATGVRLDRILGPEGRQPKPFVPGAKLDSKSD
ncbi:MAG: hypothetical protein P1V81_09865 [Planctomycetota bacterium]|nr:hypothetical protein [Planctomycetota bacterium]